MSNHRSLSPLQQALTGCDRCGRSNLPDAEFCSYCRANLYGSIQNNQMERYHGHAIAAGAAPDYGSYDQALEPRRTAGQLQHSRQLTHGRLIERQGFSVSGAQRVGARRRIKIKEEPRLFGLLTLQTITIEEEWEAIF